ncbi:MAG: glutamine--fructose-6-phosphate transaminase (isomerizing) [Saprospiraceae bacterium]
MCGIVAYVGQGQAYPILLKGLRRLEYRGYDSAGVGLLNGSLRIYKQKGKVEVLAKYAEDQDTSGHIGIAHTRWATHGEPNDINAHPHISQSGRLAMVHNGIIENYSSIKQELISLGHHFESDTDTEVFLHLIEEIKNQNQCALDAAVSIAMKRVVGSYVIVILDQDHPDRLIAARKGSPLVIGIGDGEHFLASDASPIIEYTKDVVYVNDHEIAILTANELILKNIDNELTSPFVQRLDMDLASIEKGGYDHFMIKEIFDQPDALRNCLRGRLNTIVPSITLGGLTKHLPDLVKADRIVFLGCGTSWHACLVAEYVFERLCRIPVEVEYASEFRYRDPVIRKGDIVIAVSQSGETADTLVAMEQAKLEGALVLAVCNVVGSSIARLSEEGVYIHAGPEIGVASTKAFTGQLAVLYMMALKIAQEKKTINDETFNRLVQALAEIPDKIQYILDHAIDIQSVADRYVLARDFLYLGRGVNFPVALEGALKLKEISYIHAAAYPAAEMKHGPIALVDENLPVLFVALKDHYYEKILSNIQEIKARRGQVIVLVNEDDEVIQKLVNNVIRIPSTEDILTPLLSVIPLQLFSYYIGVARGYDVDKPRNLAKSVTVE